MRGKWWCPAHTPQFPGTTIRPCGTDAPGLVAPRRTAIGAPPQSPLDLPRSTLDVEPARSRGSTNPTVLLMVPHPNALRSGRAGPRRSVPPSGRHAQQPPEERPRRPLEVEPPLEEHSLLIEVDL